MFKLHNLKLFSLNNWGHVLQYINQIKCLIFLLLLFYSKVLPSQTVRLQSFILKSDMTLQSKVSNKSNLTVSKTKTSQVFIFF